MQNYINQAKEDYEKIKTTILNTGNPKLIKYFEENTTTHTITEEYMEHYTDKYKEILKNFIGVTYKTMYSPFRNMEQIENPKIWELTKPYLYQLQRVRIFQPQE